MLPKPKKPLILNMDDNILMSVALELDKLTAIYTSGGMKHYQYMQEYDKVIDRYGIDKKSLREAILAKSRRYK